MALSEWPEKWKNDYSDDRCEVVTVTFEVEMFVAVVTDKAVGLKEEDSPDVDIWLPVSQIKDHKSSPLKPGDWIDTIEIPKWLADEKNLEYE